MFSEMEEIYLYFVGEHWHCKDFYSTVFSAQKYLGIHCITIWLTVQLLDYTLKCQACLFERGS